MKCSGGSFVSLSLIHGRLAGSMGFRANLEDNRIATSILGRNCTVPWRRVRVPAYSTTFAKTAMSLEQVVFDQQCRLWNIHDEYMDQM